MPQNNPADSKRVPSARAEQLLGCAWTAYRSHLTALVLLGAAGLSLVSSGGRDWLDAAGAAPLSITDSYKKGTDDDRRPETEPRSSPERRCSSRTFRYGYLVTT